MATDFGDYTTILGDTGAGLLTAIAPEPLARGIIDVLTHPDLAASLSAACRGVAEEHFAMDRNIDRYLDVYDRALAVAVR